jgi:hypothetical protein
MPRSRYRSRPTVASLADLAVESSARMDKEGVEGFFSGRRRGKR